MRGFLIGFAALALVACGSNDVPSPADREASAGSEPEVEESRVALNGTGLVAGPEAFYFAAGQSEVDAALSRVLGKPGDIMSNSECGAGPMVFSVYPGGLTVNFQEGVLVGWNLREASEAIEVDADIAIGTPRGEAEAAEGFAMIEGSTLGEEFTLGEDFAGMIESDAVSMLYAGTQCFFR